MRKLTAYTMLFLFLFANTEAHELLKLPFLVEHFVSHNNSDGQSVLDFLNEHYGKPSTERDSDHQHLPFKTHHSVSGLLVAELHQLPTIITETVLIRHHFPATFKAENDLLPNYLNSIWQPPKNA